MSAHSPVRNEVGDDDVLYAAGGSGILEIRGDLGDRNFGAFLEDQW